MPEEIRRNNWVPTAILVALAGIAAIRGLPSLLLALLILPVAAAVQAACGGWIAAGAVCLAAALGCVFRMPGLAGLIGVSWCAASGIIASVPMKRKLMRPLLWTLLSLLCWSGMLLLISADGGDAPAMVLDREVCEMVDQSPERNTILLNAYSIGMARLDGTTTLSTLNYVLMPEEIRHELLCSLRVSLELALPQAICDSLVVCTALTTLLCTAWPDWRRRKRGEKGEFPPMEEWYIPRGLGLAVLALGLGWLIATLSGGGTTDSYFGLLCLAVFRTAYTLQGICLLLWLEKRMGIRGIMRNIGAVLLSMLAPIVPMIMGLIDQRRDARHLRPEEVEDS